MEIIAKTMKLNIFRLLSFTAILFSLVCCSDDLAIFDGTTKGIPTEVECTVSFNPLHSSELGNTRSASDANKYMRNIFVVVYKNSEPSEGEDKPVYVYDYEDLKGSLRREDQNEMPGDADDNGNVKKDKAETSTHRYTMKFPDIFDPGTYRIYAVMNLDKEDLNVSDVKGYLEQLNARDLRRLTMTWQPMKIDTEAEAGEGKPGESGFKNNGKGTNDQMFGYFTLDNNRMSRPTKEGTYKVGSPSEVVGGEYIAPEISIGNGGTVKLHAWVRRLASKVTLVFNSSQLHERVFVYVHKATIKDIPRTCQLGVENSVKVKSPSEADRKELLRPDGESFYYYVGTDQSAIDNDNVNDTYTHSKDLYPNDYTKWMRLSKGSQPHGAVSTDASGKMVEHGENMDALYFYENIQGKYEVPQELIDNKNNPKYEGPGSEYYKGQLGNQINTDQGVGKPGFKDNVPGGTYIEVEGHYVSQNPNNQSSGPIKFRCMLGQDMISDYNSFRSCHYKLTLNFKGYGNQADWHIDYTEEDPGVFPPARYFVSYLYGMENEYPIRITSNVDKVVVQIVENNWAPFDSTTVDSVPLPDHNGNLEMGVLPFEWAKETFDEKNDRYYGLHDYRWYDGENYTDPASGRAYQKGPKMDELFTLREFNYKDYKYNKNSSILHDGYGGKVTPIWAGFLALKAPTGYTDKNKELPVGIFNNSSGDWYSRNDTGNDKDKTIDAMRDYYLGKGGGRTETAANNIPQHEAEYDVSLSDGENEKRVGSANDRNSYRVVRNGDGSKTLYIPMFTRPKSIIYISGFSGNNPYETYWRKAVLRISAHYTLSDGTTDGWLENFSPVFQVRRITNPKAIWHSYNNKEDFTVTLYRLNTATSTNFVPLISEGEWRAFFLDGGDNSNFTINGGVEAKGSTGTPITFKVGFNGCGKTETKCAIIRVEYNGYTCFHPIFLRQGVNAAIDVANDGTLWSSYAVYKFDTTNEDKVPFDRKHVGAVLTQNPLSLGTMFKRANMKQGILIKNNSTWGPEKTVVDGTTIENASLELSDGTTAAWKNIVGHALKNNLSGVTTWEWPTISATVADENREYDVPTYEQYDKLRSQKIALGVCYYDGATKPATTTSEAFMYYDPDNKTLKSTRGMRGAIIYNPKNSKQLFFPIGTYGMGRRTVQGTTSGSSGVDASDVPGVLRYGAQPKVLSYGNGAYNQYRPITYNNPANPGVLYWFKKGYGSTTYYGWDINYFDFTFGPYDALIYDWTWLDTPKSGDAVPIKLVRTK